MPVFTMRWANRSTSDQDWTIHNLDHFALQPDFVRSAQITLNNNSTFNIAADTSNTFAACTLSWTAATNSWTLNTNTPAEWQLATGGGIVTLRCLLTAHAGHGSQKKGLQYSPGEAKEMKE